METPKRAPEKEEFTSDRHRGPNDDGASTDLHRSSGNRPGDSQPQSQRGNGGKDAEGSRSNEEREEEEIYEKSSPGPHVVYKAVLKEGEEELDRPSQALAFSGFAAGLSMGFSLVTEGLLASMLPEARWRPLIAKFGYSIGFLIVVLGRQQLFTENTLT